MAFQGSGGFQSGAFQRFRKETKDTVLSYDTQASTKLQFALGSGLVEVFSDARCYSPFIDATQGGFVQNNAFQGPPRAAFQESGTDNSYLQATNTNVGMSLGFK